MVVEDDQEQLLQDSDNIQEKASEIRRRALLPTRSSLRYEDAWTKFLSWLSSQSSGAASLPDESAMLVYFDHLSKSFAPSSLWTVYSMIKRQMLVSSLHFYVIRLLLLNLLDSSQYDQLSSC